MITLVYRGHGSGQMKLLRRAIGNGKRVRVHSYGDQAVADAIADADLVVFGSDSAEPILHADQIRDRRDFTARPLTIIDFNTFGSTRGVDSLAGATVWDANRLDEEVAAYGEAMCTDSEFASAVDAAERWIIAGAARRQCRVAVEPTPQMCERCGRPMAGLCAGPKPATAEVTTS
jgi:hypothetical protein